MEDVAVLDLVEMVVEVGVVMQHEKKMIPNYLPKIQTILMIAGLPCADLLCAAFSAVLTVVHAGAFFWSVLAVGHLHNHRTLSQPTSFQIVGYPGVC